MVTALARQEEITAAHPAAEIPADALSPHLVHVMSSFAVGGIQVRLARVINFFGSRYRHTIVSLDGDAACRDRIAPKVPVDVITGGGSAQFLPVRLLRARRHLVALEPDLLLTYNWGAIEWALAHRLFLRCRHVHFEDGFGPDEVERQLPRRILFRRLALVRAAAVVVPSRTLETIALRTWHLPRRRVRFLPNGIDIDPYCRPPDRSTPPLFERNDDEVIIGTVAPLRREKNLGRLLRAFAALPSGRPARLVIAGGGPERAGLEDLASHLGIADRTVFLGPVAQPQQALALFDIFAVTSDTEQMPLTVLEAMAAALPIIATAVGDIPLMVAPRNRALIVDRDDEAALAKALTQLAADGSLRRSLGEQNREQVRTGYRWSDMIDAYRQIFDDNG